MKKLTWSKTRFRSVSASAAVLALASFTAAGCDPATGPDAIGGPGAVTGVEIVVAPIGTPDTNLVRGTANIRVIAAPHDANGLFVNTPVTWSTSDAAKATVVAVLPAVSPSGTHEALVTFGTGVAAGGDVTISATTAGNVVGEFVFNVQHPVTTVVVTPTGQSIRREGAITLTATLTDASGAPALGRTVNWVSSAPGTATVTASSVSDITGKATATVAGVADGTVTITATANNGADVANVANTATVTVAGAPLVATVTVTAPVTFGGIGQTVQASHSSSAASGTAIPGTTANWTSSAPTVATVNATTGLVTLVGEGTADIRADVDNGIGTDIRGSLTIRSAPVLVSGVGQPSGTIASGTSRFWALIVPAGGAGITVTTDAGSTGDGDLFILRAGIIPPAPPAGGYNTIPPILCGTPGGCFSGASGNTEAMSRTGANALAAGTYPIAYHAWTNGTSFTEPVTGVTITATITP